MPMDPILMGLSNQSLFMPGKDKIIGYVAPLGEF
jgi:hypothetical protein